MWRTFALPFLFLKPCVCFVLYSKPVLVIQLVANVQFVIFLVVVQRCDFDGLTVGMGFLLRDAGGEMIQF